MVLRPSSLNQKIISGICLVLLQIIFPVLNTYCQTTFQKTYVNGSTASFDVGYSIQETADSNFMLSGSIPNNFIDYGLIKTDRKGKVIWAKAYGLSGIADYPYSEQQTTDEGYIMAGVSLNNLYLVRTDSAGVLLWAKTFGNVRLGSMFDPVTPPSIQQTSDSGYIVGATILSFNVYCYYLVKIDASGNLSWARKYQHVGFHMMGGPVRQTKDGGYILAGSHGATGTDVCLIKTNAAGVIAWSKTYGISTTNDHPFAIKQTNDNGYIVSGFQGDWIAATNDMLLIKTDSAGNLQWDKVWGDVTEYERATAVIQDHNGNFVVTGWYSTNGGGGLSYQTYLAKISPSGTFIWQRGLGFAGREERGLALSQSRVDKNYLVGGLSFFRGHSFIKTNTLGKVGTTCGGETPVSLPERIPTLTAVAVVSLTDSIITPVVAVVDQTNNTIVTDFTPFTTGCSYTCTLSVTPATSICPGNSQALSASGGYGYSWSPSATLNSSSNSLVIAQPTTTTMYIVSDTVCGSSAATTLTVNPAPLISLNYQNIHCLGDTAVIAAGGGLNYWWNTGSTATSMVVSPTISTVYSLTVNSIGGCVANTSFTVTVVTPPVASIIGKDSICLGALDSIVASGGGMYTWSTGMSTGSIIITPTTNTIYTVTVNIGGCLDSASFNVYVMQAPIAQIVSSANLICAGDNVTLTASGGALYSWSNGNTASIISAAPTSNTMYSFTTSIGSCIDTMSMNIVVNQIPVANAGENDSICEGSSIILNGFGGTSYLWSTGSTGSSIDVSPSSFSTYTLIAYNGFCTDTTSVSIGINPLPVVNAGDDVSVRYGSATVLSASGGGSYSWSPSNNLSCGNCISPTASPTKTTTYFVTVTDAHGCTSIDSVIVTVDLSCGFFIPNVFSPNGDMQNDVFKVMSNCITFFNLVIFDRWGEKIFQTNNPEQGWDGSFKSKECDSDVYVYNIIADMANGESIARYGNVTLIR